MKTANRIVFCLFLILSVIETQQVHSQEVNQFTNNATIRAFIVNQVGINTTGSIYCYEALSRKNVDGNGCGIYEFSLASSHIYTYLYLFDKKAGVDKCIDTNNFPKALDEVLFFLDHSSRKYNDTEKLRYIRRILQVYEDNWEAQPNKDDK
jgi:uncharacterized protein YqkB